MHATRYAVRKDLEPAGAHALPDFLDAGLDGLVWRLDVQPESAIQGDQLFGIVLGLHEARRIPDLWNPGPAILHRRTKPKLWAR